MMNVLKRLGVACARFRARCGYGVHSPFAFSLITELVYGRQYPYYAYHFLARKRQEGSHSLPCCSQKIDQLLFRLVDRFRPECVVEVGTGSGLSSCYMASARRKARCVTFDESLDASVAALMQLYSVDYQPLPPEGEPMLSAFGDIDLLHIAHTSRYEALFEEALSHCSSRSLVVIEEIHANAAKRRWWKKVVADERTRSTFDFYEVGLVFFDPDRPKQHYKA